MPGVEESANITIRADLLIEALQQLLIAKSRECGARIQDSKGSPNQASTEQQALEIFDVYVSGIADCANQLGNADLRGIVSAFASTERAALSGKNYRYQR